MTDESKTLSPEEQVSQLFGSYKAEWLREQMYDLFTEPAYFPELTTARPCMLVGGRGTGKTTVLRCMSYEGQYALRGRAAKDIGQWLYYGLYYRVNTNRVTAFKGPEVSADRWMRLFAHYFNLVICDLGLKFLEWYQLRCPEAGQILPVDCERIAHSFNLPQCRNLRELGGCVSGAQVAFEAYINNVADGNIIQLSMQGAPVDALFEAIQSLPQFKNKSFFLLLDEYENFEDYQQKVVNTLIKQSGQLYTFKVGVRELGWRCRTTLNENEQLISPADYVKINISEKLEGKRFTNFALNVCNERIQRLRLQATIMPDTKTLLPGISEEAEAELLDKEGDGLATEAARALAEIVPGPEVPRLNKLSLLEKYFVSFWAKGRHISLRESWEEYLAAEKTWRIRYENYKHALLYTLRRGKRGIQKYYAGWDVFTQLAAGNIRYFLELVDQSLLAHFQNGGSLNEPVVARTQTMAAQKVAKKNLAELEGLSIHGAQLTKLLLGLGRIFQTMAADACGHAPEVNQFHIPENEDGATLTTAAPGERSEVDGLLKAAVMHLALLRFSGSKLIDEADTRDYDYMIHPIFTPFFVFSYRRKRKMMLSERELLEIVKRPKKAIRGILASNNRVIDEPLPEQLILFESYYRADP